MTDDDDFLVVTGRLPRHDKDGNEITGADLGSGGARRADGTLRAMVEDVHVLADEDPPTRRRARGPSLSPEAKDAVASFLAEVAVDVAREVGPLVKQWLAETVGPAMKERWRSRRRQPRHEAEDLVPGTPAIEMTSEQWQEGFRAWMAASAIEEALRALLANARVDDEAVLELQSALATLEPGQRAALAERMLASRTTPLDADALLAFSQLFGSEALEG